MSLRDQPYIPLYVQDYLTDEKLNNCSSASQGIYIKIMCLFHKCDPYGGILLKQNIKQNENICLNFAYQLSKQLPFDSTEINDALIELLQEKVLLIEGEFLFQKRMVKDNEISIKRAKIGSKGGKKTQLKNNNFAKAKSEANSEYEYVNEIEINNINNKVKFKKEKIEFDFGFIENKSFLNLLLMFIKYRDEVKNKPFTSQVEIECFYQDLMSESKNELFEATKLINKAISNKWSSIWQNNYSNSKPEKNNKPFEFSEAEQQQILNDLKTK